MGCFPWMVVLLEKGFGRVLDRLLVLSSGCSNGLDQFRDLDDR